MLRPPQCLAVFISIMLSKTSSTKNLLHFLRTTFELSRHERFALRRLITKLDMIHILGFCSSRNVTSMWKNSERNGQLEGYSARQCTFEYLKRCAKSRWLMDGPIIPTAIKHHFLHPVSGCVPALHTSQSRAKHGIQFFPTFLDSCVLSCLSIGRSKCFPDQLDCFARDRLACTNCFFFTNGLFDHFM